MKKEKEIYNRPKRRNRWIAAICIILAAFILISLFGGNYMTKYAIGRSGDGGNREVSLDVDPAADDTQQKIQKEQISQQKLTDEFLAKITPEETSITSADKLKLKGYYYNHSGSHKWALIIHGYRSDHTHMGNYIRNYYDAGYQVLSPDLRACGNSEGNYVGMGYLDKDDMQLWIQWILKQDPQAKIILHGVSMGGATVMMTSGDPTPDAVVAFVEDCGYTSVDDIFKSELKLRFHLPPFPLFYSSSILAKLKAGYFYKEASALEQVKKCDKPMLFIHGTKDDFVPFEMLEKLYQAKPGANKQKLIAEGAGHGESIYLLGDTYWETVFEFLGKYL